MDIKRILLYQFLMLAIISTETVKIGISKHLLLTTTMAPNTTLPETTTEESNTEDFSSTIITSTIATPKISSTITNSTTEGEWPEFTPKETAKPSNKITTKKPIITTIKPSTTTIIPNKANNVTNTADISDILGITDTPPASLPKWPIISIYCFCDLTTETCDINCCCDRDCSPEALKVFRCQLETHINLQVHEGRFEDFKFQHGLPSCQVNDGWLCVFRTYKPIVKEQVTHYFEDTSRYYKWPNLLLESEEVESREFYKYGDILRIINVETKEIQNFDLPSSFQASSCRIQEPIYHLKPIKRSCHISSSKNLKEVQLKLLQLQENYKIFNKPSIPDDLHNNKNLENYIENITVNSCFENEQSCTTYKTDSENIENADLYKVKLNILHNFTHIQEVIVELWLKDLESNMKEYWLTYEVEFFNKTLKDLNVTKAPLIVSGPLGYLPGKPIIFGRHEAFNKNLPLSLKNQQINYFNPNNTESHTLALFAKENGECIRSAADKDYIRYGINVAKYCKIKLENNTALWEDSTKSNFTEICFNLQQRIHDQLFGQDLVIADLSSYLISQLGKPENNSKKWLQLKVFNTDFDPVMGQYLQESNTFICRNILLSLAYEFHMTTFMVDNVLPQNVIIHAVLHLAERHDLEFALDENLEVPITMTVRFYDVHEKAVSAGHMLMDLNYLVYSIIFLYFSFFFK